MWAPVCICEGYGGGWIKREFDEGIDGCIWGCCVGKCHIFGTNKVFDDSTGTLDVGLCWSAGIFGKEIGYRSNVWPR